MAKYLVAVSGGVDSVVLLDMLVKSEHKLIVAHVEHGIRGDDSAADARFVEALAKKYQLPFVAKSLKLGPKASEERARNARYEFLFAQAKKHGAELVTAHHADDVVETIALNLTRGTGWRGLAVLERSGITRPLLALSKAQVYDYALRHGLEWVEDETNRTDAYLRNRLRAKLGRENIDTTSLLTLRARQLQLRRDIDKEAAKLVDRHVGSRYFLNMLPESVALELFGAVLEHQVGVRPARPQLLRALQAIKTANPGTACQVGDGVCLEFTSRNYRVIML